ncbi:hypothetical protein K432DRAFT_463467 [Lepidopterella palustris CBS 459.81]|uniref:Uncharacterized protein n=1 Tax=Lepidopterella palustris CBS 459.81 TaxID=1314670 RepID=A0A8E2EI61_9PEZI|nr:hypothetical protein K432DRAFT_463467 [Lepidopterella palustris CBS 459.81]
MKFQTPPPLPISIDAMASTGSIYAITTTPQPGRVAKARTPSATRTTCKAATPVPNPTPPYSYASSSGGDEDEDTGDAMPPPQEGPSQGRKRKHLPTPESMGISELPAKKQKASVGGATTGTTPVSKLSPRQIGKPRPRRVSRPTAVKKDVEKTKETEETEDTGSEPEIEKERENVYGPILSQSALERKCRIFAEKMERDGNLPLYKVLFLAPATKKLIEEGVIAFNKNGEVKLHPDDEESSSSSSCEGEASDTDSEPEAQYHTLRPPPLPLDQNGNPIYSWETEPFEVKPREYFDVLDMNMNPILTPRAQELVRDLTDIKTLIAWQRRKIRGYNSSELYIPRATLVGAKEEYRAARTELVGILKGLLNSEDAKSRAEDVVECWFKQSMAEDHDGDFAPDESDDEAESECDSEWDAWTRTRMENLESYRGLYFDPERDLQLVSGLWLNPNAARKRALSPGLSWKGF